MTTISKMDNKVNFKEILAPELNDINYAKNLSGVFENINDNFEILSNVDFVKGENGSSIKLKTISLDEKFKDILVGKDIQPYTFKQQLKADILKYFNIKDENDNKLKDIEYVINGRKHKVNVWDNIENSNMKIHMIYGENKDVKSIGDIPLVSLYCIFYDERFSVNYVIESNTESENPEKVNINDFNSIQNLSCVFTFDCTANDGEGGFKIINDVFPSIYYKPNKGWCWKLNGIDTYFSAEGIASKEGKPGKNVPSYMVKCEKDSLKFEQSNFDTYLISKIYNNLPNTNTTIEKYNGEKLIYSLENNDEFFKNYNYNEIDGSTCLVHAQNEFEDNYFGIGIIKIDADHKKVYCVCNKHASINNLFDMINENNIELIESFQNQINNLKAHNDNLNASNIYLSDNTVVGPDGLDSSFSIQDVFENIYDYIVKYENKIPELENKILELENTINKNHPENPEEENPEEENPEEENPEEENPENPEEENPENPEEGIEVVNEDDI